MSLNESIEYIEHRLLASGAEDLTQILSPSAAWRIAEAACGIPRAINILADNVLIAGLGAGQRPVGAWLADATIREFDNSGGAHTARSRRFGWPRRLMRPYDEVPADAGPHDPTATPAPPRA